MDDLRAASVAGRIFLMALVVAFGVLALVLAAVGVYGVLSLVVAERTREMGIRLALGASPRGLVGLLVAGDPACSAAGIGGGVVVALALSPLVAQQLFGIGAADPLTLAGVAGVLLAVALWRPPSPRAVSCASIRLSTLRCDSDQGTVMKAVRAWLMRLFGVFGSRRAERELSAEIESHLQLHIDDNLRAGMTPQEARRRR